MRDGLWMAPLHSLVLLMTNTLRHRNPKQVSEVELESVCVRILAGMLRIRLQL